MKNEKLPIFGICMGNQLLSKAGGAKIYKLKYGHRSFHCLADILHRSITGIRIARTIGNKQSVKFESIEVPGVPKYKN